MHIMNLFLTAETVNGKKGLFCSKGRIVHLAKILCDNAKNKYIFIHVNYHGFELSLPSYSTVSPLSIPEEKRRRETALELHGVDMLY